MRLIHRILATNTSFFFLITNDERCNFCKQQSESLEHLFWTCDVVQHFWLTFEQLVNEKCLNMVNMKQNQKIILFGKAKDLKSDAIFDFVILFAKCYLYTCKMGNAMHS